MAQKPTREQIIVMLLKYCTIANNKTIDESMKFGSDILINSIDMGEMIMDLKQQYPHIDQYKIFAVKTVKELIDIYT